MSDRRFSVGDGESGERLDVALARWLGESRSAAARRIDRGEVSVSGVTAKRSTALAVGDEVRVAPPPRPPSGAAGTPPPPVRYEDGHLLVVAKPAGVVVHPGAGNPAGTLVQALAAAGYPLAPAGGDVRPGIVHRLDRDTSGLMVVAKTDPVHHRLVAALKRREVERVYLALVEGRLPAWRGTTDVPIGRDRRDPTRFAADPEGRPARTRWVVEAEGGVATSGEPRVPLSLLRCRLETGRTHQIRVHLSYSDTPVVADARYGARSDVAAALGLDRPFLHATRLALDHPVTGERVEVDEPLPDDLARAARRAGMSP